MVAHSDDCPHWFGSCDCGATASKTLGATGDPEREAGEIKADLANLSVVALAFEGEVMRQGAAKYGAFNWAEHQMSASTYWKAILRHGFLWWTGEDIDPESGLPHLAHIRACCGILLDQWATRRLKDDRPKLIAKARPLFNQLKRDVPK